MLLTDLPLDVLHAVCSYALPGDLLALALTSSSLLAPSQRYLYHTISLHTASTAARCLTTLTHSSASLCDHVRVFTFRINPSAPLVSALPALLSTVLTRLQGLVSLDLVIPTSVAIAIYDRLNLSTRAQWEQKQMEARGPECHLSIHKEECRSGRKQKAYNLEHRDDLHQTHGHIFYPCLQRFSCNLPLDEPAVRSLLIRAPALRELQLGEREREPSMSTGNSQSAVQPPTNVNDVDPISAASAVSPNSTATDTVQHTEPPSLPSTADGIIRTFTFSGTPSSVITSDSIAPDNALPASALPRLTFFMGPSDAAIALVPGRPVDNVQLCPGELSADVLLALARSATPITVLGAFTHSLSPAVLQDLAANLPHLHYLRIMTMYHTQDQPFTAFYEQVVQILPTLPELVSAELAGIRWASHNRAKSTKLARQSRSRHSQIHATAV